jgi:FkbM family methyltransferase
MHQGALRRALPMPVKRGLKWLMGWAYVSWRRARRLAPANRRTPAGGSADRHGARPGSVSLPPGALDCVLAANPHGVYCVPRASEHRAVSQAILAAEVWESDTLELLLAADPEGDIVHAGTFFGDFLPALAHSRRDGAKVWAFEPNRENYRAAQITALLNDLQSVVLRNAGLGAERTSALLATHDREGIPLGGASRVIRDPARARWYTNEQVELLKLDDVIDPDRQVAAVHFDVEGHEQEALAGALATIARCRPLIVLETLPDRAWIERHLTPLGYRPAGEVDINHVLRCG